MSRCYDAIRCDINNGIHTILALQIDKVGDVSIKRYDQVIVMFFVSTVNNKYIFD